MKIVCSPTMIQQYVTCPLKFWGQFTKELPYKETPQKKRGTEVHAVLEKALKEGVQSVSVWPEKINEMYTLGVLQDLIRLKNMGVPMYTECEMCITPDFKRTDWCDKNALLRAKADILFINPTKSALIGDWKTGRIYENMDLQLRIEALLVHTLYNVPRVEWKLFYVDVGKTKGERIDFSKGIDEVKDILGLIKEMREVVKNGGPFLPKKNKFCRWCDWYCTEHCKEGEKK